MSIGPMHPEMASDWRDRRIRELEVEIDRLREERDALERERVRSHDENEQLRAAAEPEYERLRLALAQYETENERLRAALKKICEELKDPAYDLHTHITIAALARQALGEVEK